MRQVPEQNGAEAWRRLCNRYGQGDHEGGLVFLQTLLDFKFGTLAETEETFSEFLLILNLYDEHADTSPLDP